jgi:hypothetical protein
MAAERTAATQRLTSQWSQSITPQRLRSAGPTFSTLLLRVQGEYHEMPGLKLTEAQARRLWNLDCHTCSLVLTTLLEQRFLRRTTSGTYVRATV